MVWINPLAKLKREIGWSDTTASSVSFSSYLPQGCVYMTVPNYVCISVFSLVRTITYLCAFSAPLCSVGLNEDAYVVQGLSPAQLDWCSADGQCSHPPACSEGQILNRLQGFDRLHSIDRFICSSANALFVAFVRLQMAVMQRWPLSMWHTGLSRAVLFLIQNTCKAHVRGAV